MRKVAVVTGSGRGIGLAVALQLASLGYAIVLNLKRHADEGQRALKLVEGRSEVLLVLADVSVADGAQKLRSETLERFGVPDVLVNNAGLGIASPFVTTEETLWDKMISSNLKSVYLCTRAFLPDMIEKGSARLINITSVAGIQGAPLLSAYSAAKAGVIALTKSLAQELEGTGVTVNAIAAGVVRTKMGESLISYLGTTEEQWAKKFTLTHKIVEPEEVAALAGFLASDSARNITGQVFVIDSGSTLKTSVT